MWDDWFDDGLNSCDQRYTSNIRWTQTFCVTECARECRHLSSLFTSTKWTGVTGVFTVSLVNLLPFSRVRWLHRDWLVTNQAHYKLPVACGEWLDLLSAELFTVTVDDSRLMTFGRQVSSRIENLLVHWRWLVDETTVATLLVKREWCREEHSRYTSQGERRNQLIPFEGKQRCRRSLEEGTLVTHSATSRTHWYSKFDNG